MYQDASRLVIFEASERVPSLNVASALSNGSFVRLAIRSLCFWVDRSPGCPVYRFL